MANWTLGRPREARIRSSRFLRDKSGCRVVGSPGTLAAGTTQPASAADQSGAPSGAPGAFRRRLRSLTGPGSRRRVHESERLTEADAGQPPVFAGLAEGAGPEGGGLLSGGVVDDLQLPEDNPWNAWMRMAAQSPAWSTKH